jgi:hypothetical protein
MFGHATEVVEGTKRCRLIDAYRASRGTALLVWGSLDYSPRPARRALSTGKTK